MANQTSDELIGDLFDSCHRMIDKINVEAERIRNRPSMKLDDAESEQRLHRNFCISAGHIRTIAESILKEYFGDRCPDFDEHCEVCKRWKAMDDLIQNPFE